MDLHLQAWLKSISLERYSPQILEAGYDSLSKLLEADQSAVNKLVDEAGMPTGHANFFKKRWAEKVAEEAAAAASREATQSFSATPLKRRATKTEEQRTKQSHWTSASLPGQDGYGGGGRRKKKRKSRKSSKKRRKSRKRRKSKKGRRSRRKR